MLVKHIDKDWIAISSNEELSIFYKDLELVRISSNPFNISVNRKEIKKLRRGQHEKFKSKK
ncbi:MAG: hypothetical protein ACTSRP_01895 [Candidatus Helarchaeota archaeon]